MRVTEKGQVTIPKPIRTSSASVLGAKSLSWIAVTSSSLCEVKLFTTHKAVGKKSARRSPPCVDRAISMG